MKGEGQLTFLFAPLNAWGHINACAAIASVLKEQLGHQIIFIINQSWKGRLTPFGFQEEIYGDDKSTPAQPSQDWTNLVTKVGPIMRLSSLEKIKTFGLEAQERMVAEIMNNNKEIEQIIQRTKPDLIVIDNYVLAPAVLASGIPWVRLRSASPVEINQFNVPPQNSGYAIQNGDLAQWEQFSKIQKETYRPLWEKFSAWFSNNANHVQLPNDEFMLSSPYLNLYLYPKEIDYTDRRAMPEKWIRIDALVRKGLKSFSLPKKLQDFGTSKIIYLSLGTFGSADLSLMTRMIGFLEKMSYRVIVSKGPFHAKYDLPANMWGEESLPQTEVLPFVDGVICHGGNATLNECFYFGKPMIILPILGDEYDNAQRILETGYGTRLDPYTFTFEELSTALDLILENETVIKKMKEASARIQGSEPGPVQAAKLILQIL